MKDNGTLTIHNQPNASWLWAGGRIFLSISSSTGKSITVNETGPGKAVFDDTGYTINGGGHWLVGETIADAHGEGLWLYTGHITIRQDDSGTLVTSFNGRSVSTSALRWRRGWVAAEAASCLRRAPWTLATRGVS